MLLSKYEVYDSKKSKFIKEQEARGLLSSLGIKTLFIINQYCRPNVIQQKCVFKAIGKLLFGFLSYISNTKNICSVMYCNVIL